MIISFFTLDSSQDFSNSIAGFAHIVTATVSFGLYVPDIAILLLEPASICGKALISPS